MKQIRRKSSKWRHSPFMGRGVVNNVQFFPIRSVLPNDSFDTMLVPDQGLLSISENGHGLYMKGQKNDLSKATEGGGESHVRTPPVFKGHPKATAIKTMWINKSVEQTRECKVRATSILFNGL